MSLLHGCHNFSRFAKKRFCFRLVFEFGIFGWLQGISLMTDADGLAMLRDASIGRVSQSQVVSIFPITSGALKVTLLETLAERYSYRLK